MPSEKSQPTTSAPPRASAALLVAVPAARSSTRSPGRRSSASVDGPPPAAVLAEREHGVGEVVAGRHLVEHRGDLGGVLVEAGAGHATSVPGPGRLAAAPADRGAGPSTFSGKWQATWWPGASSTSGGATCAADLLRLPAAGVEAAGGRRVGRARRVALRRICSRRPARSGSGTGTADSSATVYGCIGRSYRSVRSASLDERAEVHDGDPVGDVAHHRQVVGDDDVGQPELVLQVLEQVDDLRLHGDVEGGDRLVGDDELGRQGERAGDADALALAAGELVRVAVVVLRAQADQLEQRLHGALGALLGLDALQPERRRRRWCRPCAAG